MRTRQLALLLVAGASLTGCSAEVDTLAPSAAEAPASAQPAEPFFRACLREPPPSGATSLAVPPEDDPEVRAQLERADLADARLGLEHALDLTLPDGTLMVGNGYEVASASGRTTAVAEPGAVAPVVLYVVDSEQAGRRVAFVEVRLARGEPATWEEDVDLGFGTDGGDGGFASGTAPSGDVDVDGYVEAFFPEQDSRSGNVCVLREPDPGAPPDGMLFSAGYGDGGYPSYVGRDTAGRVVSVVSYGGVLPWALSGLPGDPPEDVVAAEADLFGS